MSRTSLTGVTDAIPSRNLGGKWQEKLAGTCVVDVDAHFSVASKVRFRPADPGNGPVWLLVWGITAIVAQAAPVASLRALWSVLNSIIRAILGD